MVILVAILPLCILSKSNAQIIVETFESSQWNSINALSFNTNTIVVTSTATSQPITSFSVIGASAVTTSTQQATVTGTWTWMYSKASVYSAVPTTSVANNGTKIRTHSATTSLAMQSTGYLITPVLPQGVSQVTFWMSGASGNGGFQIGINTSNTTQTGYTTGTVAGNGYSISRSLSSIFSAGGTGARTQHTYNATITEPCRIAFEAVSGAWIDDIVIIAAISGPPNPTATTLTFPSTCATNQLTVTWTGPTSYNSTNNTIVAFLKEGSAVTKGTPSVNLSTYTANTTFTSGTPYENDANAYCIYKGDGTDAAGNHSGFTVTGLNSATTYHLLLYNVVDATPTYSSGAIASSTTIKTEPTNHPTAFAKGTVTTSNIPLTWTASVAGTQAPDGYLIKASSSSTPSDPADGTDPTDQTNISGGTANVKLTSSPYSGFTGFTAGTMYYFKISPYTNTGSCINFKATGPDLYVATLPNAATSPGISISGSTGTITWATAGYDNTKHTTLVFVKANTAVTVGAPDNDPAGYTANSALGSGTAYENDGSANCIYNGDGITATVSGLSAGVTYHVLILTVMSSANSDASHSYSSATITSATPAAEYTWIGGASSSWTIASNWNPTRTTPQSTDVLTINNPTTVNCSNFPGESIAKLIISGNCSASITSSSAQTLTITSNNGATNDLIIDAGSNLTLSSQVNTTLGANTTADISGTLTVNGNQTYNTDASGAVTTVSGTIINSGTVTSTNATRLIIASTGTYRHNVNGGTIPTASWNTNSTCLVTGITSAQNFSGHRQTFSKFVWDCPGQTASHFVLGENSSSSAPTCIITDSFIIKSTNDKILQITSTGGQRDFTVGNFFLYGGKVAISYNTDAGGDQRSLTVNNTFYVADSLDDATFQLINQPAAQNVSGRLFLKGNVDIHRVNTAAYLSNFSSNSKGEIYFNGTTAQYAKFDITTGKVDFFINNTNGVYLQSNASSHRMKLQQGNLYIGSNTLTIAGPVSYPSPSTGLLAGTTTSNLTIGASGYAKNDSINIIKFASGYKILKNLSLYDTANAVLGTSLTLTGGTSYGALILDTLSTLTTNDSLTLQSTAAGTARVDRIPTDGSGVSLATITGKITIERYLPMNTPFSSRRWRLMTAPVSTTNAPTINEAWQEGVTSTDRLNPLNPNPGYGTPITKTNVAVDGFDQGSTNNPSIYKMAAGSGNWTVPSATNSGKITDNNGYMIFVRGDRSIVVSSQYINTTGGANLRVKGEINKGRVTIPVVAGKQVIGNPYPSTISMNDVSYNGANPGSTLGTEYYLWDPKLIGSKGVGQWATFSSNGDDTYTVVPDPIDSTYMSDFDLNGTIDCGVAFMIDAASSGSFIFNETDKVNSSNTIALASRPSRTASRPNSIEGKLFTNLAFINNSSEPVLADGVANIFGNSFDNAVNDQDAQKLQTFTSKEKIALFKDNTLLAIERRKVNKITDTIFYHISIEANNNYQLQFKTENFAPTLIPILEDLYTKRSIQLENEGVSRYNFATNTDAKSIATDRFRIIFYKTQGSPLPVRFIDIIVGKEQGNVLVEWKVTNEENILYYQVECSIDGIHFVKSATVHTGTQSGSNTYRWEDITNVSGLMYYRVVAVGRNDERVFSKVVHVSSTTTNNLSLLNSNISTNELTFESSLPSQISYTIQVSNTVGQQLFASPVLTILPNSIQKVKVNSLISKGVYFVTIRDYLGNSSTYKVIK